MRDAEAILARFHAIGRPPKTTIDALRARSLLREVRRQLGLDTRAFASTLVDSGIEPRTIAHWCNGMTPSPKHIDVLSGLWKGTKDWWGNPLWRLLNPQPLAATEVRKIVERFVKFDEESKKHDFHFPGDKPQWARDLALAANHEILAICKTRSNYLNAFHTSNRSEHFVGMALASAFCKWDADVLYLRGDLCSFVAIAALVREADAECWSDLYSWRSLFLIRSLPFALRHPSLRIDARILIDAAMEACTKGRLWAAELDIDVEQVTRLADDPSYQPSSWLMLGETSGLVEFLENQGLTIPRVEDPARFCGRGQSGWQAAWTEALNRNRNVQREMKTPEE